MSKVTQAVEVRMNIRCGTPMSWQTMVSIIKGDTKINLDEHGRYLYGFFEEVYPALMKKFIEEHDISRNEIITLFDQLPEHGEKCNFREALKNGEF